VSDPRTEALETYFRLMTMNGGVQVYRAALGSGILQAIVAAPATAADAGARCGLRTEPVRLVLDTLAAAGLLRKSGELFEAAPAAKFILGPYRDLGDLFWNHLPKLLATGEPLVALDRAEQGEAFYQAQAASLEWMLATAAETAAPVLASRSPRAVLDVGAGSAVWSLALAKRDRGVTVTALDRPGVLQVAQAAATRAGVADRFTALPGEFLTVALPEAAFDLAIVANVAHLLPFEGNVALLRRLHRTLRPGGAAAVIDVVPGSPAGDLPRALYALGLALRTKAGRTYTREELDSALAEAGFSPGTWTALDAVPHTLGLVVAAR
jgi:SAM-dependent methyltransferase